MSDEKTEDGGSGTETSTRSDGGGNTRPFTGTCTDAETKAGDTALFDFERLDVYRVAREFIVFCQELLARKMSRELHDQFDTSTMSLMENIGEGAGKTARAEKRRYYEIARGSAMEAATQLDLLLIKQVITQQQYDRARNLLIRIVKMLSRMCAGPRKLP